MHLLLESTYSYYEGYQIEILKKSGEMIHTDTIRKMKELIGESSFSLIDIYFDNRDFFDSKFIKNIKSEYKHEHHAYFECKIKYKFSYPIYAFNNNETQIDITILNKFDINVQLIYEKYELNELGYYNNIQSNL